MMPSAERGVMPPIASLAAAARGTIGASKLVAMRRGRRASAYGGGLEESQLDMLEDSPQRRVLLHYLCKLDHLLRLLSDASPGDARRREAEAAQAAQEAASASASDRGESRGGGSGGGMSRGGESRGSSKPGVGVAP